MPNQRLCREASRLSAKIQTRGNSEAYEDIIFMSKLTEILAPDGSKIYIQYDEEENDELLAVGFIDDAAERTERFKAAINSTIKGYAGTMLGAVKSSLTGDSVPDKIQLEFGIQVGGETGIPFVTKGTAQANVKVTIEWDLGKKFKAQGVSKDEELRS